MQTIIESTYFEEIKDREDIPFDLLQLADPFLDQIKKYVFAGKCYVLKQNDLQIGVIVLNEVSPQNLEVMNLAVSIEHQNQGLGKKMLEYAIDFARKLSFQKLIISTGNSSIGQLALYQKVGFEIVDISKDYFVKNYPEPIYENGIQCKHQLTLEMKIIN